MPVFFTFVFIFYLYLILLFIFDFIEIISISDKKGAQFNGKKLKHIYNTITRLHVLC